ncbi:topoisomerase [Pseudomaricurvus alkylphenolicus]|uniref:toprim domain-containing protein n=1 Tax=Pseudomaricurvus alkylphenolicus TaxID=1306991 RepID=UPI001421ABAD|nr:toprim domain-containing protein [Pseudomaricurvus alkylphenolicus]NIB45129.1 topoisomerase [Pseudomaricurvus alkylphenolicus]
MPFNHQTDSITVEQRRQQLEQEIRLKLGADIETVADGKIHRHRMPGKSCSNRSIWVWVSPNGDRAVFGNHVTCERYSWTAEGADLFTSTTGAETRQRIAEHSMEVGRARLERQSIVAETARLIAEEAERADENHPYLQTKRVLPHGLFQLNGALQVPLRDATGEIHNMQRIYRDGTKRFMRGGRVKGLFAEVGDRSSSLNWYITEGWATAATVHDVTGDPALAAMNAGNLMEVCLALASSAPPGVKIVIVADNDHRTQGNPGLTKAVEAATAIGADYVTPDLPCNHPGCACTDVNDVEHCVVREVNND